MNQLQIEFFWPLTEQIPLDLDYSLCKPKTFTASTSLGIGSSGSFDLSATNLTTTTSFVRLETDNLIISSTKEQPWYRKMAYKLLGIRLEKR